MAGVERAKRALWSLLRTFKVQGSAKLTVSTAKGKLKVILEESFDVQPTAIKATKRPSPSQLRRKERRAADPAVQQRAAEHQAQVAATGEVLASPEKERASSALNPLQTSPVTSGRSLRLKSKRKLNIDPFSKFLLTMRTVPTMTPGIGTPTRLRWKRLKSF